MNRIDLFENLFLILNEEGFINSDNFRNDDVCKEEFIRFMIDYFKEFYILDLIRFIE